MRPRPRPRPNTVRPKPRPRPKKWPRDHAGFETLTSLVFIATLLTSDVFSFECRSIHAINAPFLFKKNVREIQKLINAKNVTNKNVRPFRHGRPRDFFQRRAN